MIPEDITAMTGQLVNISSTKQYWFIRTQSGIYYADFVINGFISIGYDDIGVEEIKLANQLDRKESILKAIVKQRYAEDNRPGYIANQLLDFAYGIKEGDIVIIPSSNSDLLSFGEVTGPVFTGKPSDNVEKPCPFVKRRSVKWIRRDIRTLSLDPQVYRIRFAHRTLTNLDNYAGSFIDRLLYPLFIKSGEGHLAVDVKSKEPIRFVDLFSTWNSLLDLTTEFSEEEGIEVDRESFDIRINVQSPGTIELISHTVMGVFILAVILSFVVGAKFTFKSKLTGQIDIDTPGVIERISRFMSNQQRNKTQKILNEKLKNMNIDASEIVKLMEQINDKQNPTSTP